MHLLYTEIVRAVSFLMIECTVDCDTGPIWNMQKSKILPDQYGSKFVIESNCVERQSDDILSVSYKIYTVGQ